MAAGASKREQYVRLLRARLEHMHDLVGGTPGTEEEQAERPCSTCEVYAPCPCPSPGGVWCMTLRYRDRG